MTWRDSGFRAACRRLLNLLKRDGPVIATGKIVRYLKWRVPAEIRLRQIKKLATSEDRFTRIYQINFWAATESASGPGSSLDDTRNLRRQLPILFDRFAIKTVFDAPCGDFNWMKAVVKDCAINYVGADIVKPMIERNILQYRDARTDFVPLDITRDAFPNADLWICRDCFCHLSLGDVFAALRKFIASDIPYLLASTQKNAMDPKNNDIISGDYRPTDMFASPFSLPREVLFRFDDNSAYEMCLWSRDQIIACMAGRDEALSVA